MKASILILAGLMFMAGGAASAQEVETKIDVVDCRAHNAAQEAADADLADKALTAMQGHDMAALDALTPQLQAALSHAPDMRAQPEHCGDRIIVHSDDPASFLILSGTLGKLPGIKGVDQQPGLPYGLLGFIVGWTAFEHKDYAAAAVAYEKGLKNEPDLTSLEAEYVLTLSSLGRNTEALSSVDAYLAAHGGLQATEHANLLRKRGYVLVEMGQWDNAKAAYEQSLALEPGNTVAASELEYIAKQRPSKP